jgi:hypothetical protein
MGLTIKNYPGTTAGGRDLHGKLIMTDYMMLFVLLIGVFLAMDPFQIYADKRSAFKHLHLVLLLPILALAWMGGQMGRRIGSNPPVLRFCWPLVLFALWVIGGALYSRFHDGVVETFMIMGLYMLLTPLFARFIADHPDPTKLLNRYLAFLLVAILVGTVWQAAALRKWNAFHEEEYLTVPLAVFFFVRARTSRARVFAITLLLFLTLTVIKNTSFIAAGASLGYVWWGFIRKELMEKPALKRLTHYLFLSFAAIALAGMYVGLKSGKDGVLPDGNPKYRFFTYERTWKHFQDSPIWGMSFSGAGAEKFGLFTVAASTQVLPTHSDVLDILAQGGLIGIGLFIFATWKISRNSYLRFSNRSESSLNGDLIGHFHWLAVSCLVAVPVFAFNPILLQPGKAFVLWMNFGILLGLALRCEVVPRGPFERKSFHEA